MRLLCGRSNLPLARAIAARLGCALDVVKVAQFADGEISVELTSSVRGEDVFIVQPTSPPVNDHLMELLLIASACSRASARCVGALPLRVVCGLPCLALSPQRLKPMIGIRSAWLNVTNMASHLLISDCHHPQNNTQHTPAQERDCGHSLLWLCSAGPPER